MTDRRLGVDLHVLLVEDDADLRVTTAMVLERHGFRVTVAEDGLVGWQQARADPPDLAVVDVVMPGMDGLTLTRRLRGELDVPVVLLTARDLTYDELAGFEAGADDYVTKPFDGVVLAARLRAVARRTGRLRPTIEAIGPLTIDRAAMSVHRGDEPIALTATELRLLLVLVDHAGAVLSRAQILRLVWGDEAWGQDRVVDVNVQRLRAKVGPQLIETVRGAGYKLVRP